MADLLSREGHPLARSVLAARDKHDPRALVESSSLAPRRTLGFAAGAALVLGTVAAGVLGLNNHGPTSTPTAAAGEPLGALPGRGAPPAQPGQAGPQSPAAPEQQPQFVNTAATQNPPAAQAPAGRAGQIGIPAAVPPPKAPPATPPAQQPNQPPPAQSAPQAPAPGPVQGLTAPVDNTTGGALTPLTSTVDHTLQPALSLIGGLLGH